MDSDITRELRSLRSPDLQHWVKATTRRYWYYFFFLLDHSYQVSLLDSRRRRISSFFCSTRGLQKRTFEDAEAELFYRSDALPVAQRYTVETVNGLSLDRHLRNFATWREVDPIEKSKRPSVCHLKWNEIKNVKKCYFLRFRNFRRSRFSHKTSNRSEIRRSIEYSTNRCTGAYKSVGLITYICDTYISYFNFFNLPQRLVIAYYHDVDYHTIQNMFLGRWTTVLLRWLNWDKTAYYRYYSKNDRWLISIFDSVSPTGIIIFRIIYRIE